MYYSMYITGLVADENMQLFSTLVAVTDIDMPGFEIVK
jgi:hypothetical protein